MNELTPKCLIFGSEEAEAVEMVASLLGQEGIHTRRSTEVAESLDLLAEGNWFLLVMNADRDANELLRLLLQFRQARCDVPVLVLVQKGDVSTTVQAMKAGAADCVEKPVKMDRLLSAVTSLCRQMGSDPSHAQSSLTPVERIVLKHLLDGRTSRQIAELLCRSCRTIEVHRGRIMEKLRVANLVELVRQTVKPHLADWQNTGSPVNSSGRSERA